MRECLVMRECLMRKCLRIGLFCLVLALPLVSSSCGRSNEPLFNLNGSSFYIYHSVNGTPGVQGPGLFLFNQSSNEITGTTPDGLAFAGTVTGLNISWSWLGSDGFTYTYSGALSSDGNTMSGIWSNTNAQTGSFNGIIQVAPPVNISGQWNLFQTPAGAPQEGPFPYMLSQSGYTLTGTTQLGLPIVGNIGAEDVLFYWTGSDGVTYFYTGVITSNPNAPTIVTGIIGTYSGSNGQLGTWTATPSS